MDVDQIKLHCAINFELSSILQAFVEKQGLSMRSYYKILKVARTIADIAGSKSIGKEDLLEAIQYRGGFNY
jgi:magnesium chelatase family protein